MKVEDVYLTGTHRYTFRAGEPARVIGVKMATIEATVGAHRELRVVYHIRFEDGQEDYVAKSDIDAGNWEFITLRNMIMIGVPKITK